MVDVLVSRVLVLVVLLAPAALLTVVRLAPIVLYCVVDSSQWCSSRCGACLRRARPRCATSVAVLVLVVLLASDAVVRVVVLAAVVLGLVLELVPGVLVRAAVLVSLVLVLVCCWPRWCCSRSCSWSRWSKTAL